MAINLPPSVANAGRSAATISASGEAPSSYQNAISSQIAAESV
jgi:hypothetical protein